MTETQRETGRSLADNKCVCGDGKRPGRPFCRMCTDDLAPKLRGRLAARSFGAGYEEAFSEALERLVELKKVTPDEARRFSV